MRKRLAHAPPPVPGLPALLRDVSTSLGREGGEGMRVTVHVACSGLSATSEHRQGPKQVPTTRRSTARVAGTVDSVAASVRVTSLNEAGTVSPVRRLMCCEPRLRVVRHCGRAARVEKSQVPGDIGELGVSRLIA